MSQVLFFDSHTHIHFAAFKNDWREAAQRARDAGVWFMTVGTQRDTSSRAVEVANLYPEGVYAAVGLHPVHTSRSFHDEEEIETETFSHSAECENVASKGHAPLESNFLTGFTSRAEIFDFDYYKKLASDPKVLAIGECGLDYYDVSGVKRQVSSEEEREKKERQKEALLAQIKLANEVNKPLMLHCRDGKKNGVGPAFDDLVDILKSNKPSVPFVSHSFVRDSELSKKLLDLGSYFSFNGIITFTHDYDEVIRSLPLERILSETDAPYLSPVPHRGERNEPAYVVEVVKKLAGIRGLEPEKMKEIIWENTKKVFGISA